MRKYKNPQNHTVIELHPEAITFNLRHMQPYFHYPFKYYGCMFAASKETVDNELKLYVEGYKRGRPQTKTHVVKQSQHIPQNGCMCKKCRSMTIWHRNYMRKERKRVKRDKAYYAKVHGELL